VTTSTYVDIPTLVRNTVCDIGYDNDAFGFNGRTCGVMVALDEQSPDIARASLGLRTAHRIGRRGPPQRPGRGRPGMMFGYACDETPDLMRCPSGCRTAWPSVSPRCAGSACSVPAADGKTQVSVIYEDGRPVSIDTILISTQHQPGIDSRPPAAGPA